MTQERAPFWRKPIFDVHKPVRFHASVLVGGPTRQDQISQSGRGRKIGIARKPLLKGLWYTMVALLPPPGGQLVWHAQGRVQSPCLGNHSLSACP